jgi:hypothetical protein
MGFKVDFSSTEVRDFEPLPSGKYHVAVTDGDLKESGPKAKNPGSEYISWEFTVQDGEYENRKLWTNASLLPQALFTLKGLLAATGFDVDGELDFDIDDVIGAECIVTVRRVGERTVGDTTYGPSNNITKFEPYKEGATVGSQGGGLLP